ncbi:MAG: Na+/H+ antiporter subunit E [Pseudomonadota bacterium]
MLFFFTGILFLKILFNNIYLLPIWYIIHQYISPIPITIYSLPIIISIILRYIIISLSLDYKYNLILLTVIPYSTYFAYYQKPNPISDNRQIKEYINYLIYEIFKSNIALIYKTIRTPVLKTNTIITSYKLNTNMTALLAGSITATPCTYTITTIKNKIVINTIDNFDDSLCQHSIFNIKQKQLL